MGSKSRPRGCGEILLEINGQTRKLELDPQSALRLNRDRANFHRGKTTCSCENVTAISAAVVSDATEIQTTGGLLAKGFDTVGAYGYVVAVRRGAYAAATAKDNLISIVSNQTSHSTPMSCASRAAVF